MLGNNPLAAYPRLEEASLLGKRCIGRMVNTNRKLTAMKKGGILTLLFGGGSREFWEASMSNEDDAALTKVATHHNITNEDT